jgi:catechol 2,3-dioxygenase-like lactoylglutathione lyase family enzyme
VRVNYSIIYVSNMNQAVAFYRDVLGLPLRFETPAWTEFATEGATLALHAADPADGEAAGQCRPGFAVPNLAEFHLKMTERNVPCLQEPKQVFGAWLAQYRGPDGLAISVSEARRG